MIKTRDQFLEVVRNYVETDPGVSSILHKAVEDGINGALNKLSEKALMMETVAVMLATRKHKGSEEFIKEKLRDLKGSTCFDWEWFTK